VDVPVPPVSVTGLVPNEGVAPVGNVVVTLRLALQVPPPFEVKVIAYVAELP
jgi:hypothetical protein